MNADVNQVIFFGKLGLIPLICGITLLTCLFILLSREKSE